MTLFIPLAVAVPARRTECLKLKRFTMPWRWWLFVEMVEGVTEVGGLGDDVVGAEMNESPMSLEADVDELVVVTVEREEAVTTSF